MSDVGFVKLYRKILSNAIAKNLELLGLFSALLLKASFQEKEFYLGYKKVVVKPGQFVSSVRKLSVEFRVSVSKMYRMLEVLKSEHILEHEGNTKYSLFTIVNRHKYQVSETQNETQSRQQTKHEGDTIKNDNNNKEGKEDIETPPKLKKKFVPPTLEQVVSYFRENGYIATAGEKAWKYYNAAGWVDSKGNQVKNRKQKMLGVRFKEENKDKTKSRGLTEAQRQERLDALSN